MYYSIGLAAVGRWPRVTLLKILFQKRGGLFDDVVPLEFGAASRFAIRIVVVMGMLIGTMFTLFVLPTFYKLIAQDHRHKGADHELTSTEAAGSLPVVKSHG